MNTVFTFVAIAKRPQADGPDMDVLPEKGDHVTLPEDSTKKWRVNSRTWVVDNWPDAPYVAIELSPL